MPLTPLEWHRDGFTVSTDPARLDVDAIHAFLSRTYWAENMPRATMARAVENCLCFGLYAGAAQIGLARVVTDHATFAYLTDVYVLESHRGQGLSKWLVECILAHPQLQGLRRFNLVTRDAHTLYERFGFKPLSHPEQHLERYNPDVYKTGGTGGQSSGDRNL